MLKTLLLLSAMMLWSFPAWAVQEKTTASSDAPAIADQCARTLEPLDSILEDLENESLPLKDESGQPLGHRPIENRRQALAELRQTLDALRADPASLKWAATLLIQSESLSDDLYDLSQIAYDNDHEELGKRLSEVVNALDAQQDSIESLTLSLADAKENRIRQLEDENATLRQQLKEATARH